MIRVGLYSQDSTLKPPLSSALSNEFQFIFQPRECGIDRLLAKGTCSVVLLDLSLDLNSSHDREEEFLDSTRRLVQPKAAWVVMADDALRSAAAELVRLDA